MNKEKCVVICSGGLDSTVLLYDCIDKGFEPIVVSFNYGQRHVKELDCITEIRKELKLQHQIFNLSDIFNTFTSSALIDKTKELPMEHYTNESQKLTVVSNRNGIMLNIAAGVADNLKINKVFYGCHSNDFSIYRDCRLEYVHAMSEAIYLGTDSLVEVLAPFVNISKSDVVKRGIELNVPFEKTWSCYSGEEKACGKCGTCQERLEAFKNNNITDKLKYE
jgi:7-cyano-7-deazaguanine synthase